MGGGEAWEKERQMKGCICGYGEGGEGRGRKWG